nr:tocopherol cyclase family protein [uncultured Mogibacterium sp.]
MAEYYHGREKRGPYFEGWYLKHQTRDGAALALIPAYHIDRAGQRSASLQVIAEGESWWLEYPATEFHADVQSFCVQVGHSLFASREARIHVEREGLSLHGIVRYGPFTPLKSDIMGPFRFLPFMECAHGVISMGHPLEGSLTLNGKTMDFSGGMGYVETDRGRSFPDCYLWTQCVWQGDCPGSVMLSIATIPLAGLRFTGCICVVCYGGREYRLATYRGARVERWSGAGATVRQGMYRLTAELLEGKGCPLRAPVMGVMGRTVRESLRSTVRYRFWDGEALLFEHLDRCAGFEYAETVCRGECAGRHGI